MDGCSFAGCSCGCACGCGGRLEWEDRTARMDAIEGGFVGSYGSIVGVRIA